MGPGRNFSNESKGPATLGLPREAQSWRNPPPKSAHQKETEGFDFDLEIEQNGLRPTPRKFPGATEVQGWVREAGPISAHTQHPKPDGPRAVAAGACLLLLLACDVPVDFTLVSPVLAWLASPDQLGLSADCAPSQPCLQ